MSFTSSNPTPLLNPPFFPDHSYLSMSPYSPETDRTMLFYENVRVDGLLKRVEKTLQLTEEYQKRPDRLYYRNVTFGRRAKTFAPSETKNSRPIEVGIRLCNIVIVSICWQDLFLSIKMNKDDSSPKTALESEFRG